MNIAVIGKHIYPKDIFSNEQDMKTWRSMAKYFDNLFVVAQSPDLFFHAAKENNVKIYLVPIFFSYIGFVIGAVKIGFYLNWRYGIDAFDASEIVGGGIAAIILKIFTKKPVIIEVQGEIFKNSNNSQNLKNRLLQRIGRYVMKKADRVRVISNAIFSQVREQKIPESKIRLVFLRVDLNLFNPLSILRIDNFGGQKRASVVFDGRKSAQEKIRDQFFDRGEAEEYAEDFQVGITLGYIGRLVDGKGLEDLFEAIAILKSRNLKFRCLIFGTGPLEAKLKKLSKGLNITDKIEWRGFSSYSKVPEALAEIDIFVYPSWHEGFGRSIMEALAMEKAVVATNVGGIPDLIKDGENGFLLEPRNPTELAEKIKILIDNEKLREKFGRAGREHVVKNFEWNDGIKKFAQLFLELKRYAYSKNN